MVIFHSYVGLLEGNIDVEQPPSLVQSFSQVLPLRLRHLWLLGARQCAAAAPAATTTWVETRDVGDEITYLGPWNGGVE